MHNIAHNPVAPESRVWRGARGAVGTVDVGTGLVGGQSEVLPNLSMSMHTHLNIYITLVCKLKYKALKED
jgi:hypothetical protein